MRSHEDFCTMPIDGGPDQHLKGFSGTWMLLHIFESKLRSGQLEMPPHSVGCCQEVVQVETLCSLDMSGGRGRDLASLWISGLHCASPGPNESDWEFTSAGRLGTVAPGS